MHDHDLSRIISALTDNRKWVQCAVHMQYALNQHTRVLQKHRSPELQLLQYKTTFFVLFFFSRGKKRLFCFICCVIIVVVAVGLSSVVLRWALPPGVWAGGVGGAWGAGAGEANLCSFVYLCVET